jgi:hypothetical protein
MALPYDISEVEAKLLELSNKSEKLNYLNNYLFGLKKKMAEFKATDNNTLKRLRLSTKNDFEKYKNEFDNGGLIYFNTNEIDVIILKRFNFENIPLLKERIFLENTKSNLKSLISLFGSLIDRVESEKDSFDEPKKEPEMPTFENTFDTITPTEIYKHFKAGLVEKGYLTEQELNEYLKAAFELKTIPETRFKIKDAPNKAAIEAVFYNFYKNVSGKIHGKQKQYAALLGDYFEGYKTTTVSSNFSKSVY